MSAQVHKSKRSKLELMHYKEVLKKIKAKVASDFFLAPNPKLLFYSLDHIKEVVPRARKIGNYYKLEHELLVTLLAAAWFQDMRSQSSGITTTAAVFISLP
ncbi:hypothetical protein LXM25_02755 [Dyadobacter sp. LJ53]|uniref:hypothetical protein n=1 Tax=Dyadobacter chenwenxiniae TaxID=2906456 RepID=UPI001F2303B2|nr:hypothetical protein [Dyadobacter chenwenxiniae]MCF0048960.1 hypothetical protein [Dyadobacter chenwenxiniae]